MQQKEVPEVLRSKGINTEVVEALSDFKREPGWLKEKRLHAWRTFERMPMPTLREEAWRYTDISDVSIEDFAQYTPSPDVTSEEDLPEAVQTLIREGEENSALLVQHNSETAFSRVDEELARREWSLRTCTPHSKSTRIWSGSTFSDSCPRTTTSSRL
jgi:Fe-S cluster assembly protein SufD